MKYTKKFKDMMEATLSNDIVAMEKLKNEDYFIGGYLSKLIDSYAITDEEILKSKNEADLEAFKNRIALKRKVARIYKEWCNLSSRGVS